jgi:CBS domain-containing protein
MNVANAFEGKVGPVVVFDRHTLAADGTVLSHGVVPCPLNERSLSIKKCARCEFFGGTVEQAHGTVLLCHCPLVRLPVRAVDDPSAPKCSDTTPLSSIMKSVVCVRPELGLEALERLLVERGVSGVPVVDEKRLLTGVVSQTDVVRHEKLENDLSAEQMRPVPVPATVAEVMTRHPVALRETASIAEAVELMLSRGVHRIPIVSETGAVLAMVTPFDVLAWVVS